MPVPLAAGTQQGVNDFMVELPAAPEHPAPNSDACVPAVCADVVTAATAAITGDA